MLFLAEYFRMCVSIENKELSRSFQMRSYKRGSSKGLKTPYLVSYYLRSLTYLASTMHDHVVFILE